MASVAVSGALTSWTAVTTWESVFVGHLFLAFWDVGWPQTLESAAACHAYLALRLPCGQASGKDMASREVSVTIGYASHSAANVPSVRWPVS